jgi:hypothetical protein
MHACRFGDNIFFFLFKNRFGVNIFYIINKNDFFLSFNTSLVKLYD